MPDRMPMWVAAGLITAGLSASLLVGAGAAAAVTDPSAGGTATTADSAGSAGSQTGRAHDRRPRADDTAEPGTEAEAGDDSTDDADADDKAERDTEADDVPAGGATDDAVGTDDTAGAEPTEVPAAAETPTGKHDTAPHGGAVTTSRDTVPTADDAEPASVTPAAEPGSEPVDEPAPVVQSDGHPSVRAVAAPEPAAQAVQVTQPSTVSARLALMSASDAPRARASAPRQTLLSLISTVIFNVYTLAVRTLGGPPLLPWGSTVTVRNSSVAIDCGKGYDVPANWYVPQGATPTSLIYLQHGFLAAGPFYSYTASRLAEATHSIVVTTTLTSNFLACDGCWVGGSPMHKAVADLFGEGNGALADSATAAGYSTTLLDGVTKVALVGHSAGGGLVAGTAGYMVGEGTIDRLAGVVMLDGVGFGTVVPAALAKLPDDVPIYNLSGKSYFWNMSGSSNTALEQARPGEFYGVRLVGGLHSDTMVGGNIFIQAGLYLVTGFSKPANVKAAEILSAAWINDMFAGVAPTSGPLPSSPYYGVPGQLLDIATPRGAAQAYVSPGPAERLTLVDRIFTRLGNILFAIDFATCVADPQAGPAENPEILAPNTALSLDGRTKARQSIGQHVCTG